MDQAIVGVIDAQGYYLKNRFYPVELAVVGDGFSFNYRLSAKLYNLSERDAKQCNFVKNKIHGISLNSNSEYLYTSDDVDTLISRIYLNLKNHFKQVVLGCKNDHLKTIIDKLGVDYVNLANVPSLKELDKLYCHTPWFCSNHSNQNLRCSLRKCVYMWKWIKNTGEQKTQEDLSIKWKLVHSEKVFSQSNCTFKSFEQCFNDYLSYCKNGFDVPDSLPLKMVLHVDNVAV
jgi:hypothetical protein